MKKNLYKLLIACGIMCLLHGCDEKNTSAEVQTNSSKTDQKSAVQLAIGEIPQFSDDSVSQVLVLGTFHFDRKLDGSDVVGSNHLDIHNPEAQKTIESIAHAIASKFKPTIIAIEWLPEYQSEIDSLYNAYTKENMPLRTNEAFQLGFRIAKLMNMDKIHCVDNKPPQPESIIRLDDVEQYAKSLHQEKIISEFDADNATFNSYIDSMLTVLELKDYLLLNNSPEYLKRCKALSLTGLVNLGAGDSYAGADLTGSWYQRNTRIFVNVRKTMKNQNERILVIYGAAHKWVLDELFSGSPEFEVVQPITFLEEK